MTVFRADPMIVASARHATFVASRLAILNVLVSDGLNSPSNSQETS
jgi:hypothetical protein